MSGAGAKVIVIDRGPVGYEASSRATGYLSLRAETPTESPLAQMAETTQESKEFWDEYRERVKIRENAQKGLVEPR